MQESQINPKIFISYSHDSEEHKDRVLALSDRLRAEGINCIIDQYETSPPEGWARWCDRQIEEADFVLVVCTEKYEQRFKGIDSTGKGKGAKWGGAIITQELYETQDRNKKFIPIIFTPDDETHIPISLRVETYYIPNTENGYTSLYHRLTNQPFSVKANIDKLKSLPSRSPKQNIFNQEPELILIEESIHTASICDQPANLDALGFKPYVEAIADFLTNPDTIPPLTLSIEGQWGCGKSSFMLQLEEILKEKKKIIVEFNAWRHDTEESMWAAFAIEFIRQISSSQSIFQRFKSYISLNFQRFSWKNNTFDLLRFLTIWFSFLLVTFAIIFLYFSKGFQWSDSFSQGFFADSSLSQNALKWLISLGSGAGLLGLIISALLKLKSIAGSPFDFDFNKYFKSPDYENRVTFIESFHNDFKNIVNAYAGDNKIYIFIDDLDRCEIPKAAELMQGLNLMISDNPHLVFIIGLDREKVAASFAVKHEKLLPYLSRNSNDQIRGLEYGYAFIEKFIQLPFSIPQPGKLEIQDLLKTVSTKDNRKEKKPQQTNNIIGKMFQKIKKQDSIDKSISKQPPLGAIKEETFKDEIEKSRERIRFEITGDSQTIQDIALMVAPALDYNPRRIKQFLNLFRLRTYIASATGLFDFRIDNDECLTLEQLGKFVAISLRWPLLLADMDANRELLVELQDKALGKNINIVSDSAKYWSTQQKLLDLLSSGCLNDDTSPSSEREQKCSLSTLNLDKLLQVSPRVIRLKKVQNVNLNDSHQKADERINNLGNSSHDRGNYAEDEALLRQSLEKIQKTRGQDHPDVAISLDKLAKLYMAQNNFSDAEPLYIRALAIREKALGQDHPDIATSLNNLTALYRKQGKYAEAEPMYRRALEISEKSLGTDHPHVATSLNNLAELYRVQGKYEEAEPMYRRALEISEKSLGSDHPDIATSLNNLALLYDAQGKYDAAESMHMRALEIREKSLDKDHPDLAQSLNNLAGLYYAQSKFAEAEPMYRRALEIWEKSLGENHPNFASGLENLAALLRKTNRNREAKKMEERARRIRDKTK